MKYLIYEDEDGFIRRVIVKDDDTEAQAKYGIHAGPPDVRQIDWNSVAKDINNVLAESGSFSWDDVNRSSTGVESAVNIFRRALLTLYRQEVQKSE